MKQATIKHHFPKTPCPTQESQEEDGRDKQLSYEQSPITTSRYIRSLF